MSQRRQARGKWAEVSLAEAARHGEARLQEARMPRQRRQQTGEAAKDLGQPKAPVLEQLQLLMN